jgi:hypothetical protein
VQKQLHTRFFGSCPLRGQLPKNRVNNSAEALSALEVLFSFLEEARSESFKKINNTFETQPASFDGLNDGLNLSVAATQIIFPNPQQNRCEWRLLKHCWQIVTRITFLYDCDRRPTQILKA